MCFSPEADLLGGLVLGAIGVDVVRHVHQRRDHVALAALPLLFAAHQITEAFVWWGLQGHVSAGVGRAAMWAYLVFAFVVLPVYVPWAIQAIEPTPERRRLILPFVVLGAAVSTVLGFALVRGPVSVTESDYHLTYHLDLRHGGLIVAAYVAATCGCLLFSGYRRVAWYGVVNLVVVVALARLTMDGFASLWCAWAAVTSAAIAAYLRFGGSPRSVVEALA